MPSIGEKSRFIKLNEGSPRCQARRMMPCCEDGLLVQPLYNSSAKGIHGRVEEGRVAGRKRCAATADPRVGTAPSSRRRPEEVCAPATGRTGLSCGLGCGECVFTVPLVDNLRGGGKVALVFAATGKTLNLAVPPVNLNVPSMLPCWPEKVTLPSKVPQSRSPSACSLHQ